MSVKAFYSKKSWDESPPSYSDEDDTKDSDDECDLVRVQTQTPSNTIGEQKL